jgi:hypothetical protein
VIGCHCTDRFVYLFIIYFASNEPGSSVSIMTGFGMGDRGSIFYGGGGFFLYPLGPAGSVANPASRTMGTADLRWCKFGRSVMLTTHTLLVPWFEKERGYTSSPPVFQNWRSTGNLHLFTLHDTVINKQWIRNNEIGSGGVLHLPGWTEKNHINFSQSSLSSAKCF